MRNGTNVSALREEAVGESFLPCVFLLPAKLAQKARFDPVTGQLKRCILHNSGGTAAKAVPSVKVRFYFFIKE